MLLLPAVGHAGEPPTDENAARSPADKRSARRAAQEARLQVAIDDYESRYSGWHLNRGSRPFHLRLSAELGFVGLLSHTIQFGQQGTKIDYLVDGGQNNLFALVRPSVDLELFHHLMVTFLYQPFDLRTTSVLQRDIQVDDTVFPDGSGMDMRWGFTFYRLSVAGDVLPHPERELLFGFSGQLRNATIDFTSANGSLRTTNRDVGFVPLLKARFRWTFNRWFVGAEVDGSYAGVPVVNGSTDNFVGAFVDASLRGGVVLRPVGDVFANLRYVDGGSRGTDSTPDQGDGYNETWIHSLALTLGVQVR